jgi:hypothetical protein
MAQPTVTRAAQELYDAHAPIAGQDEQADWPLLRYLSAIARMFDWIYDLVSPETGPPWSPALDVDRAPAFLLPWLAQFVGIRFKTGRTEAEQRAEIRERPRWKRGRPAAIEAEAKLHLTGTKTVYLNERHGSAYLLTITTLVSETPDVPALQAAILDPYYGQKPAGIVLDFVQIVGGDWLTLDATHADWTEVIADLTDWSDAIADPSQT